MRLETERFESHDWWLPGRNVRAECTDHNWNHGYMWLHREAPLDVGLGIEAELLLTFKRLHEAKYCWKEEGQGGEKERNQEPWLSQLTK